MSLSQKVGAAVALKALGYPVKLQSPPGTVIEAVVPQGPSVGKLREQDVILAVDGRRTPSLTELRKVIGSHRPGDPVELTVRRGQRLRQVKIKTVPDPQNRTRPMIGVFSSCASQTFPRGSIFGADALDLSQVSGPLNWPGLRARQSLQGSATSTEATGYSDRRSARAAQNFYRGKPKNKAIGANERMDVLPRR